MDRQIISFRQTDKQKWSATCKQEVENEATCANTEEDLGSDCCVYIYLMPPLQLSGFVTQSAFSVVCMKAAALYEHHYLFHNEKYYIFVIFPVTYS